MLSEVDDQTNSRDPALSNEGVPEPEMSFHSLLDDAVPPETTIKQNLNLQGAIPSSPIRDFNSGIESFKIAPIDKILPSTHNVIMEDELRTPVASIVVKPIGKESYLMGSPIKEKNQIDPAKDSLLTSPDAKFNEDISPCVRSSKLKFGAREAKKIKLEVEGNCEELEDHSCVLETRELWEKFHEFGTEMIVTKTGR